MDISGSVIKDLKDYLLAHEEDIYYGINDFGALYHVFHVFIEREAISERLREARRLQYAADESRNK